MRAKGNGAPNVCVNNLLRLFRGEVPYERVKGLDPRIVDKPFLTADARLRQDADWLIDTYEPRAEIKSIAVTPSDVHTGGFSITADIGEKEE